MQDYKIILFDLDGTLTDSAPGILNSVRYACRKLGLPIPGEETLRRFLGPPLIASFRELMGLDAAGADRAVSAFREYFPTKGLFENEVYPGIPALLADIKSAGKTVSISVWRSTAISSAVPRSMRPAPTRPRSLPTHWKRQASLTRAAPSWSVTASMMCWVPRKTACPASGPSTATARPRS